MTFNGYHLSQQNRSISNNVKVSRMSVKTPER